MQKKNTNTHPYYTYSEEYKIYIHYNKGYKF